MEELSLKRDALVIYLKNLSIVETIIYQSQKKIKQLSADLESAKANIQATKQNLSKWENYDPPDVSQFGDVMGILFSAIVGGIVGLVGSAILSWIIGIFSDMDPDGVFSILGKLSVVLGASIGALACKQDNDKVNESRKHNINAKKQNIEINQRKLKRLEDEYRRKEPLINEEILKLKNITSQIDVIRKDMYDLNLIPYAAGSKANLRTLAGVQYLYEFMSHSRESFTTAVYNFKLDAIISRLDALIANTELMIKNQQSMMQQQDETLQTIREQELIQQNMNATLENIRDYDALIEQNSKIQTALAQEALYYQRVRFYNNL